MTSANFSELVSRQFEEAVPATSIAVLLIEAAILFVVGAAAVYLKRNGALLRDSPEQRQHEDLPLEHRGRLHDPAA